MEKKTRIRAPNFTINDNILLIKIVDKHKHIIENKKTDGPSIRQKQQTWQDVTQEFNSCTSGYQRTLESLQQNYKNLKKKAKKRLSNNKMNVSGEPPPCDDDSDPVSEEVNGSVSQSIDGEYIMYDEDSCSMESQNKLPVENKTIELETTPDLPFLFNDTTKKLQPSLTHKSVADKFRDLASDKMELIHLQKEMLLHQLADEKEKLEHNRLLRTLELEEIKRKYKHNEKLRNLELLRISNVDQSDNV